MKEKNLTKKCSRCGVEKPLSEFHKNRSSKDGLQNYCKQCSYESNKISRGHNVHKVWLNPDLAKFQPRELIAELKARGYSGELSFTQRITV